MNKTSTQLVLGAPFQRGKSILYYATHKGKQVIAKDLDEHEEEILRNLPPHPNLIRLVATTSRFLVVEQMDTDILDVLLHKTPTTDQKMFICIQIVKAIRHCHQNGVAHLDIKPDNFVVSNDFKTVKLIDFEMSTKNTKSTKLVGTTPYRSPQVQAHRSYDCKLADIWSLGLTLYAIANGRNTFNKAFEFDYDFAYFMHSGNFMPYQDDPFSNQSKLIKLIRAMVKYMPSARWNNFGAILAHLMEIRKNIQLKAKCFATWHLQCAGPGREVTEHTLGKK